MQRGYQYQHPLVSLQPPSTTGSHLCLPRCQTHTHYSLRGAQGGHPDSRARRALPGSPTGGGGHASLRALLQEGGDAGLLLLDGREDTGLEDAHAYPLGLLLSIQHVPLGKSPTSDPQNLELSNYSEVFLNTNIKCLDCVLGPTRHSVLFFSSLIFFCFSP